MMMTVCAYNRAPLVSFTGGGEVSMTQADDQYKESRDVWDDFNHRQEFEHDLINRKTSWWLTSQTILFAAYGVTLRSDVVDENKASEFREVVALSGLTVAVVTFVGILALIISKYLHWRRYRKFYSRSKLRLPGPQEGKPLPWGVETTSNVVTLVPDFCLPLIFAVAWLCLLWR
jgi:hypothetical protein